MQEESRWRNRSPHSIRSIHRWQPCSSKARWRGTAPTTSPTSTWPSSGPNHPRHRSVGTSSDALREATGPLRPLPEKRLLGRRETFEEGWPSTCATRRSRPPKASWRLYWSALIPGSPGSSAWPPCALLVLLGLNHLYYRGWRWLDRLIDEMQVTPPNLSLRLKQLFAIVSIDPLASVYQLHELVEETFALVESHLAAVDTRQARARFHERGKHSEHAPNGLG